VLNSTPLHDCLSRRYPGRISLSHSLSYEVRPSCDLAVSLILRSWWEGCAADSLGPICMVALVQAEIDSARPAQVCIIGGNSFVAPTIDATALHALTSSEPAGKAKNTTLWTVDRLRADALCTGSLRHRRRLSNLVAGTAS
jgi:hypothetical protein